MATAATLEAVEEEKDNAVNTIEREKDVVIDACEDS